MDAVKVVYAILLLVGGAWIFVAPFLQKGDERRKFINTKAQSYAFIVVIGILILEVAESIYRTAQGESSYTGIGISPIMFLTVVAVIYLGTLLVYRKKYGD
ncbi:MULTISPECIES: hypothetical protein [Pontibacillus]|uniref:Integral membrane protein n=1 Tax=Pontibacillus chungwhensis TaxID=265426 RepID=A0ABY8V2Y2_9BACI|nr:MULTISPECIES: hypothetical protein [Pontibacillus]MCD5324381.1 hypothetical protein [Pontibacillus sp. HN14]WIG00148.1 hypothetical protein QNI29_06600 [Pontibacillus chungwhensis]